MAESITSGNMQRAIGEISGVSRFFVGGVTAYSIPVKAKLLQVDPDEAEAVNAVSKEVALSMADGALKLFDAQMAIATTGYAEPYAERKVEEPMAFFACVIQIRGTDVPVTLSVKWTGKKGMGRVEVQKAIALEALVRSFDFLESRLEA